MSYPMNETPEGACYEVMFCTGLPGQADMVTYSFVTLEEARECRRESREASDPHFRWSKITDLTTGKQLME